MGHFRRTPCHPRPSISALTRFLFAGCFSQPIRRINVSREGLQKTHSVPQHATYRCKPLNAFPAPGRLSFKELYAPSYTCIISFTYEVLIHFAFCRRSTQGLQRASDRPKNAAWVAATRETVPEAEPLTTPQRFPQDHRRQREKAAGGRFEEDDHRPRCHCWLLRHTSPQPDGECCGSPIQALPPSSSAGAGWEPPAAPPWLTVTASLLLPLPPAARPLSSARPPCLCARGPSTPAASPSAQRQSPYSPHHPPARSDLSAPALRPLRPLLPWLIPWLLLLQSPGLHALPPTCLVSPPQGIATGTFLLRCLWRTSSPPLRRGPMALSRS